MLNWIRRHWRGFFAGYVVFLFALIGISCMGVNGYELFQKTVYDLQQQGVITSEQAMALIQAFQKANSGLNWGELGLGVLSSVIFSLTGVRFWRGGVESRKGTAPTA